MIKPKEIFEEILVNNQVLFPFLITLFLFVSILSMLLSSPSLLSSVVSFCSLSPFLLPLTILLLGGIISGLLLIRSSLLSRDTSPYYSCLEDYWYSKIIPEKVYSILIEAIQKDYNILIVGEEKTDKWKFASLVRESRRITRLSSDRTVYGDVSSESSALSLLEAWACRKPVGLGTITASSAKEGLQKFENFIAHPPLKYDSPEPSIQSFGTNLLQDVIAKTINLVVHIVPAETHSESTVFEIILVKRYARNTQKYITERIYYEPQQY